MSQIVDNPSVRISFFTASTEEFWWTQIHSLQGCATIECFSQSVHTGHLYIDSKWKCIDSCQFTRVNLSLNIQEKKHKLLIHISHFPFFFSQRFWRQWQNTLKMIIHVTTSRPVKERFTIIVFFKGVKSNIYVEFLRSQNENK